MKRDMRIKIAVLILLSGTILFVKAFSKQKDTPKIMVLRDGIYEGTSFKFPGPMKIQLTVKENEIKDIRVRQHLALAKYTRMLDPQIKNIIATQSAEVDAISGATISSNALKEAVKNALTKAMIENKNSE